MASSGVQVVPAGRETLWEVMTKTRQGVYLLRATELKRRICLGMLASAMRRTPGARVHGVGFQSNHYHLLLSVQGPQMLARFLNIYNGELAVIVNLLEGEAGRFWEDTYSRMQVLPCGEVKRAEYLVGQGVREGLYEEALENPCAHTLQELMLGEKTWGYEVDVRAWLKARRKEPTVGPQAFMRRVEVGLTPLPHLAHLDEQAQRAAWQGYAAKVEGEARAKREAEQGEAPAGPEAMAAVAATDRPRATKRGRPAPRMVGSAAGCALAMEEVEAELAQRDEGLERLVDHLAVAQLPASVHLPSALQAVLRRQGVPRR